jgi:phospholipid/cholesterol/gamma-HCH transport system substrate-binding protein
MEQDGYYFRVGIFVAIALFASVIVIGWFAGHGDELGKTTYAIYMKGAVNGLTPGAPVSLGGIQVGNVKDISFASSDGFIRVLADIVDTAPVRADTVASLQLQGITGTSLIGLENSGLDTQPITKLDKDGYKIISSKPSPLERVFTTIPELIDQVTQLSQRGQALLDDKNIAAVHALLLSLNSSALMLNDLLTESKGTLREVKMLSRTLREDPSVVLFGTKHEGVKVP